MQHVTTFSIYYNGGFYFYDNFILIITYLAGKEANCQQNDSQFRQSCRTTTATDSKENVDYSNSNMKAIQLDRQTIRLWQQDQNRKASKNSQEASLSWAPSNVHDCNMVYPLRKYHFLALKYSAH